MPRRSRAGKEIEDNIVGANAKPEDIGEDSRIFWKAERTFAEHCFDLKGRRSTIFVENAGHRLSIDLREVALAAGDRALVWAKMDAWGDFSQCPFRAFLLPAPPGRWLFAGFAVTG
jgi:hypothetical protein